MKVTKIAYTIGKRAAKRKLVGFYIDREVDKRLSQICRKNKANKSDVVNRLLQAAVK